MRLALIIILIPILLTAQENNAILCSDGIDNNNNGLIDCEEPNCINFSSNACAICGDGISFADILLEYTAGCATSDPEPEGALGLSDYDGSTTDSPTFTFLGEGGILKLGFTNNILINSGDARQDLWIFEVGPVVESIELALRPLDTFTEMQLQLLGIQDSDLDGYYEFGMIEGATSGLDIDAIVSGYSIGELKFDAVEVKDVLNGVCNNGTPGADIDAICAVFSLPTDCAGVFNGMSELDECGECLEPSDPDFNQSCIDCLGIPNGLSVLDECGECLEPSDPNFNQSCTDCEGVFYGISVLDECGECLEPNDPNFNQSCTDCAGIVNGQFILDECGECLEPSDPNFNQSCIDCLGIPNGMSVIDECGECLEPSNLNFNQSCTDCAGIVNGMSVLDECGECLERNDPNFNQSCTIYIPNVFSPNDDGINDDFQVFKNPETDAQILKYMIFNRWGALVYEQRNLDFGSAIWWDGKTKGYKANLGVYVYSIHIGFQNGITKEYKGDVTMVR